MWLSAAHIPGTENCNVDTDSREFNDDSEWMVSDFVFKIITDLLAHLKLIFLLPGLTTNCPHMFHRIQTHILYPLIPFQFHGLNLICTASLLLV